MIKFQIGDIISFDSHSNSILFFRSVSFLRNEKEEKDARHIEENLKKAFFIDNDHSFGDFVVWLQDAFGFRFKRVKRRIDDQNLSIEIISI